MELGLATASPPSSSGWQGFWKPERSAAAARSEPAAAGQPSWWLSL